ncbi:MAG: bifunctional oligoribonuclease/PAP phosphatase NrnA [Candidatus Omnitrophica bacterium]|nr:bifunctional oligoribonuclease/PAP phosphatase NrnA [Candidatus Omnitrophota bacterium]
MPLKEAVQALTERDTFVISSHVNLEGDAVGAQLAFFLLLQKMGKKAYLLNGEPIPEQFRFLPYVERAGVSPGDIPHAEASIVLDCPTLDRTGPIQGFLGTFPCIVNIDHHISNQYFGSVNWVEGDRSSVGEMIYLLYQEIGIEVCREAALCMYVSIATDTGNFSYSNTSAQTHIIAAELIKRGLQPELIHNKLRGQVGVEDIRALAEVLCTLSVTADGSVAYLYLSRKTLEETGTKMVNSEYYVDYARFIKGVKVGVFFRENDDGIVKVSLRSKGDLDVNRIAQLFGGGGHAAASGCELRGTLREAIDTVVRTIQQHIGS